MLRRTLSETVWYPPHSPRTASALYTRTHHQLVYIEDRPCVVCGVRNSTLGGPLALAVGAKALETHHNLIEWAGQNEIDYDKLAADHPDLTTLGALAGAYHAHLNANSGRFEGTLDPAIVTAFIDSADQLIVACDAPSSELRQGHPQHHGADLGSSAIRAVGLGFRRRRGQAMTYSSTGPVITHCSHGLDMRLYPRCFLCTPLAGAGVCLCPSVWTTTAHQPYCPMNPQMLPDSITITHIRPPSGP